MTQPISFYTYLENQKVAERSLFVNELINRGYSRQQVNNWIRMRRNVPEEHHQVIEEVAGIKLSFPKLKITVEIIDETI